MGARFYFFTDPSLLGPQTAQQAYGPAGTSNGKDLFRVTDLHQRKGGSTADVPAFALCDGLLCAQAGRRPLRNTFGFTMQLMEDARDLSSNVGAVMRTLCLGVAIVLSFCGPAAAWDELGHKIVCEIAYCLATPAARAEVRRLTDVDTKKWSFSDSCVWADDPGKRDTEHYVNLRRNQATIVSLSCPFAPRVLGAIESDRQNLADKSKDDGPRLVALKFLAHWVGDIHQPVHVSLRGDSSGNAIGVFGECTFSFHDLWDTYLVERRSARM